KKQAHVHIFHAYRPFTSAFQSPLANQTDEQRAKIGAEKGLVEFISKLGKYVDVQVTSSTAKNSLVEAINHYIKEDNVSSLWARMAPRARGRICWAAIPMMSLRTYPVRC